MINHISFFYQTSQSTGLEGSHAFTRSTLNSSTMMWKDDSQPVKASVGAKVEQAPTAYVML